MVINGQIRKVISSTPPGVILTTKDFDVEMRYKPALVKALGRLMQKGKLQKISKGKYYIPKTTIFGSTKPNDLELVKDFLQQGKKTIGYVTGTTAFATMGLTTQISSSIVIGCKKYRRPITRNGLRISFLQQDNSITVRNTPLLRILDALLMIKQIPATSPDECVNKIRSIVKDLSNADQRLLQKLSLNYKPYVRALLGAIYENLGLETTKIRQSLNGVTYYKLPISDALLWNKTNWNIR